MSVLKCHAVAVLKDNDAERLARLEALLARLNGEMETLQEQERAITAAE